MASSSLFAGLPTEEEVNKVLAMPDGPERDAALAEMDARFSQVMPSGPPKRSLGQQARDFPAFISQGILSPLSGGVDIMNKIAGVGARALDPGPQGLLAAMNRPPDPLSGQPTGGVPRLMQAIGETPGLSPSPLLGSANINQLIGLQAGQQPESFSDKVANLMGTGLGFGAGAFAVPSKLPLAAPGGLRADPRAVTANQQLPNAALDVRQQPNMIQSLLGSRGGQQFTAPQTPGIGQAIRQSILDKPKRFVGAEAVSALAAQQAATTLGEAGERIGELRGEGALGRQIGEDVGMFAPAASRAALASLGKRALGPMAVKKRNIRMFDSVGMEPTPAWVSPRGYVATAQEAIRRGLAGDPVARFIEAQGRKIAERLDKLANAITPRNLQGRQREKKVVGRAVRLGLFGKPPPAKRRGLNRGNTTGTMGLVTLERRAEAKAWGEAMDKVGRNRMVIANRSGAYLRGLDQAAVLGELRGQKDFKPFLDAMNNQSGFVNIEIMRKAKSALGSANADYDALSRLSSKERNELWGLMADDMRSAFNAAGPDALRAYNRARGQSTRLHDLVDRDLKKIVGKAQELTTNTEFFNRIERASVEEMEILRKRMPQREFDIIAANYLKSRFLTPTTRTQTPSLREDLEVPAPPGGEIAGMVDFKSFLNGVATMRRKEPRMFETIFGGTSANAKMVSEGVEDLLRAANRVEASGSNVSTFFAQNLFASFITRLALFGQSRKLIMKPGFSRWMADMTQMKPSRVPGHIAKGVELVKGESPHIQEFMQTMLDQLARDVGKAAAEESAQ